MAAPLQSIVRVTPSSGFRGISSTGAAAPVFGIPRSTLTTFPLPGRVYFPNLCGSSHEFSSKLRGKIFSKVKNFSKNSYIAKSVQLTVLLIYAPLFPTISSQCLDNPVCWRYNTVKPKCKLITVVLIYAPPCVRSAPDPTLSPILCPCGCGGVAVVWEGCVNPQDCPRFPCHVHGG